MGGGQPTGRQGAAAAGYLAALLRGSQRSGEVVAARSDAALAVVGTGSCTRLIAIAERSAGATCTANTVLLAGSARPAVGTAVHVGEGALLLADRGYRITRYWPSGLRAAPVDPAALVNLTSAATAGTPGLAATTVRPLFTALVTRSGLAAAARSLVGLGPGSTPAGDDVLAGVALGLRVAGRQSVLALLRAAITAHLTDRTTALSADLLRAALAGHASPEVLALVRTLRPGAAPTERRRAVDAVLRLGHTSGADLLLGLTGALLSPAPASPPDLPAQSRRMATR